VVGTGPAPGRACSSGMPATRWAGEFGRPVRRRLRGRPAVWRRWP